MTDALHIFDALPSSTVITRYEWAEGYRPTITGDLAIVGRTGDYVIARADVTEPEDWETGTYSVELFGQPVRADGSLDQRFGEVPVKAVLAERQIWRQHKGLS